MAGTFRRLRAAEEGQDLIEYALIAGLVSVICVGVIKATGISVDAMWNPIKATVADAVASV